MPRTPRLQRLPQLLAPVIGVALGLIATVTLAGPAEAHHQAITADVACDAEAREWVVTWTVTAERTRRPPLAYTVLEVVTEPTDATVTPSLGQVLPASEPFRAEQRLPGDATSASLGVRRKWFFRRTDGWHARADANLVTSTVTFDRTCAPAAPVRVEGVSSCAGLVVTVTNPPDGKKVTARLRPTVGEEQKIPLQPGEGQTASFPDVEGLAVTVEVGDLRKTLTWDPPECAPPEPGEVEVTAHSTCEDLTVELDNPRDGVDTVATVTPSVGGPQEVAVPAGEVVTVTMPGAEGLSVDVLIDEKVWVFAWVPGDCAVEVPISFASDCDSLTVEITNPQVAGALEATVTTDTEQRATTVAPLETTEVVVAASPGTVATVTAGLERVEAEWQPPPECLAAPASGGIKLPRTGSAIATAIVLALAMLALGTAGFYVGSGRRPGLRRRPRHRRAA